MSSGFAGLLVVDLHFAATHSLKEKRAPLRSIKQHLRNAGCSVAEVAWHDAWQRSQLAISSVGRTMSDVSDRLDAAFHVCERDPRVEVVIRQRTIVGLDEIE